MSWQFTAWFRGVFERLGDYALMAGFLAVAASGALCVPAIAEMVTAKFVQLKAALF